MWAVERRVLRIIDGPGDHHSPPHGGLVAGSNASGSFYVLLAVTEDLIPLGKVILAKGCNVRVRNAVYLA
jgi:hypothetical protein